MQEQWQNFSAMLGIAPDPLPRASSSFHHRIDRLEMTRIGGKANLNFRAALELSLGPITKMIFHVAVACDEIGNVILGKLGKDDLERFSEEICEHVEAAAVRHPHADFFNAGARDIFAKCDRESP